MTTTEILIRGARRYEKIRTMTPLQFEEIWHKSLTGLSNFDTLVDEFEFDDPLLYPVEKENAKL